MNAVLSGDTAMAAVPWGQPEPFTVATLMTILSGGGSTIPVDGSCAGSAVAKRAAIAPLRSIAPAMVLQSVASVFRRRANVPRRELGVRPSHARRAVADQVRWIRHGSDMVQTLDMVMRMPKT